MRTPSSLLLLLQLLLLVAVSLPQTTKAFASPTVATTRRLVAVAPPPPPAQQHSWSKNEYKPYRRLQGAPPPQQSAPLFFSTRSTDDPPEASKRHNPTSSSKRSSFDTATATATTRSATATLLRSSADPLGNNNDDVLTNNVLDFIKKSRPSDRSGDTFVGEDSAAFDWSDERWGRLGEAGWTTFVAAVGAILAAVAVVWVVPSTGYADDFQALLEATAGGNSHLVTLAYGLLFPLVHSGLASLRPIGERAVGARAWRVVFAFPSLCLAYSWIAYFIAHAHDGVQFFDLSGSAAAHAAAWCANFVSFFFLYPTVFRLKEVAAVERPQIRLWETGIIRITRHPQYVGQCMWSAAHLAMIGTSFTALTMALLVGHHYFACWNGDRRLLDRHGEDFLKIKERTSIVPFQAVIEGRQVLPPDYYKELLRAPYAVIAVGSMGAYFAHPYMQAGAALVQNTGLVEGGIFDRLPALF